MVGGGWMDGGNLCGISILILKRTKSLKDLSEDSRVFLINILVSCIQTRNLLSIVSFRLAYWRRNSSCILSSNTPVEAKVVKGVTSRGVLEMLTVASASSMICRGCEVTSTSIASTILYIQSSPTNVWLYPHPASPSVGSFVCLVSSKVQPLSLTWYSRILIKREWMLFKCRKLCPSSYNDSCCYSFRILVQVKDKPRAKIKSIMDEVLIGLIIFFLP